MQKELMFVEVKYNDILYHKNIFINIIFHNFIDLINYPYVKHTQQDIHNLLSSEQMIGYIVKYDKKIIAYMFGEVSHIQDGRNAYYLSYIYVAPKYQHLKIGTLLLNKIINHCHYYGIPFIILTCDTKDIKVMNFYKKFGFIVDPILKNGKRHNILCLYLS